MNLVFVFLVLNLSFLLVSSAPGQEKTASEENILVSNTHHFISYKIEGADVIFTIEGISDFDNDFRGEFPKTDFFTITADVDLNGKIDEEIDVAYSIRSSWKRTSFLRSAYRFIRRTNAICPVYMYGNGKSSTCGGYKSEASLKRRFEGSKNQSKAHPIFIFKIPKTELSQDGKEAHLVFKCYSSGRGYRVYPLTTEIDYKTIFDSFKETITIRLD